MTNEDYLEKLKGFCTEGELSKLARLKLSQNQKTTIKLIENTLRGREKRGRIRKKGGQGGETSFDWPDSLFI